MKTVQNKTSKVMVICGLVFILASIILAIGLNLLDQQPWKVIFTLQCMGVLLSFNGVVNWRKPQVENPGKYVIGFLSLLAAAISLTFAYYSQLGWLQNMLMGMGLGFISGGTLYIRNAYK